MLLSFLLALTLVPVGHVNDFANMLKPETITSLETSLSEFERTTNNEIAVVTIETHGSDETIETYAEKIFQEWGIGKEKEDNGLLLLIARDDREMRIEVGYGLEPIITDIESSRIIREILTPAFQSGEYDRGTEEALAKIIGKIGAGELGATEESSPNLPLISDALPVLIFFLIFVASILARSKSWWAGGILGAIIGVFIGGFLAIAGFALAGLLFDYIVSKTYKKSKDSGMDPPWWIGGGHHGGGGGGGFGGFGGGMSGGGGASGRW